MKLQKLQQGDIIIKQIDKKPKGCKLLPHLILAGGQEIGNTHQIKTGNAKLYNCSGKMILVVKDKPVNLLHAEHLKISIPVGTWNIYKVKEYDHFTEEAREVQD